jgi:hypothetical protein
MALRVVQYYSLDELASDASPRYAYHVAAYKALGDSLKSKCGSNLEVCSATNINSALDVWSWSAGFEDVRSTVVDFLASYETLDEEEDVSEIEGEAQVTSMVPNGDNADIYIEGTIKFENASQMNNYTMTADCPGFTCELTWNQKYTYSNEWKYKMVWHVTAGNAQLISTLKAGEKPAVVLTDNATGATNKVANVFVLKPEASNLQRMVIFNTEPVDLTVLMPIYVVCDIEKAPFKIGASGFREDLFKTAGCCQFITDETSSEFLTYCTADCINTNFATMCNPNATVGNNADTDVYSINESYRATAGGTKELNYACIVDVAGGSAAITNTNNKKDEVGNYYALMAYNSNQYCSISCKEDWDISTASFSNFIGEGAKAAGQTFSLKPDMFIGGSRTCVTTYIDYDKYIDEQTQLSKELVEAWNKQSMYSKVYSELKASATTTSQTYYTYTRGAGYKCDPYSCGTEENPKTCWHTCYNWTKHVNSCNVSKVTLYSGRTFDKANWRTYNTYYNTDGYATSGSQPIASTDCARKRSCSSVLHA